MSPDAINSWIEKAKHADGTAKPAGIQVVRRAETRGNVIMEIADKIRPYLAKMFEGVRDEEGMLLQPAHIRGIALNVAQGIVNKQQHKTN